MVRILVLNFLNFERLNFELSKTLIEQGIGKLISDVRTFAYNVVGRFLCSPTSLEIFTYEKMSTMVDFHDWIDFSYLPNKVSVFSGMKSNT